MRTSIFDYKFKSFSVRRSVTDAMWSWEMEIAEGYPIPETWEPVEAVKWVDNVPYCILVGFPISKEYNRSSDEHSSVISGFSYGWYVSNRPIMAEDRLLESTIVGNKIVIENPIEYLSRLIHGEDEDNPCGLIKGNWDETVTNWGTDDLPYMQFEASDSATVTNQIDDICEYTGLFYLDGWESIDGVYQPVSYLCSDTDLDAGCKLPGLITINADSTDVREMRVMVDSESVICGDKWYNSVWVDGVKDGANDGYFCRKPAEWNVAEMGLEYPYLYNYTAPDSLTAAKLEENVTKKCEYLYDLLTIPAETFTVQFFDRYDLKLMQSIRFTGFPTIPDMVLRITEIEYSITGPDGCICTCTCASERSWSAMRKLSITLKRDWAAISNAIKNSIVKKRQQVTYGSIKQVTPNGTVIMEDPRSKALSYVTMPNTDS